MKKNKRLQIVLSLTFTLLFASLGSAQDIMQNEPDKEMEWAARNEVERWEDELSLRAKQMMLMEKKFVEYAIKRQRIMNENIPAEEKLERLTDLKMLEMGEIRDILTKPQFDRYILLLKKEAEDALPPPRTGNQ